MPCAGAGAGLIAGLIAARAGFVAVIAAAAVAVNAAATASSAAKRFFSPKESFELGWSVQKEQSLQLLETTVAELDSTQFAAYGGYVGATFC